MDRRNALMDYYTTADVLNTPINRGAVLPLTEYADRAEWDMSSGLPGMIGQALTAPGRAYRGEIAPDQEVQEAMNFAGLLTLGGYMAPKPANALGAGGGGIKAFHGSPHDFDKFSMEHIGKGEGAQSYGHGLYFAENEGVARSYRNSTSKDGLGVVARGWLRQNGGDIDKAIAYLRGRDLTGDRPFAINNRQALSELEAAKAAGTDPGHMYEVRINADPQDFLDWDRPLSQQSEKVRMAIQKTGAKPRGGLVDRALGINGYEDAKAHELMAGLQYDIASPMKNRDTAPSRLSNALREAGIPGIRYLDQGSRGTGEGSSNYVVFDDSLIEILRKYGLLGPVAAGTLTTATSDGEVY